MELGEAEEDLQKIGTIMASLWEVCEPPDGHDGNLNGTDRDSWKFANVIAQTEGQLQQFWVTEYDPQELKSRSTLSCTNSDPGSYTNNGWLSWLRGRTQSFFRSHTNITSSTCLLACWTIISSSLQHVTTVYFELAVMISLATLYHFVTYTMCLFVSFHPNLYPVWNHGTVLLLLPSGIKL